MKDVLKMTVLALLLALAASCSKSTSTNSTLTGIPFNNARFGNYIKGTGFKTKEIPLGMVAIEGGAFTMGQVQDDIMFDWNTTPKKIHVRSFYMDETEVTNSEY